jgi:hypothetical protein
MPTPSFWVSFSIQLYTLFRSSFGSAWESIKHSRAAE